jgi:hypothetical protein
MKECLAQNFYIFKIKMVILFNKLATIYASSLCNLFLLICLLLLYGRKVKTVLFLWWVYGNPSI